MSRRYLVFLLSGLILGSIWFTPAIANLINADTVGGIGASRTPARGKLLPLNKNKKFSNSVIRTGHGNGLNADTVDGKHAAAFVQKNGDQAMAGKLSASGYNLSPPKTGRITVSPHGLGVANSTTMEMVKEGDDIYSNKNGGYFRVTAPVVLPDGARITGFSGVIKDWSAEYNVLIYLSRVGDSGGHAFAITGSSGSSGAQTYAAPIEAGYNVVDNSNYSYHVEASWESSAGIAAVKIGNMKINYEYSDIKQ